MCKRIFSGTFNYTEEQYKRADIDGDGKVTAKDYLLVKRKAVQ